jgi:hypothetical protein
MSSNIASHSLVSRLLVMSVDVRAFCSTKSWWTSRPFFAPHGLEREAVDDEQIVGAELGEHCITRIVEATLLESSEQSARRRGMAPHNFG